MTRDARWRRLGILMLWIAAVMLGVALVSKSWLVGGTDGDPASAGLWSIRDCNGDDCTIRELTRDRAQAGWDLLGLATMGATAASLLALLFLYATVRRQSTTALQLQVTTLLLLCAVASGIGYVLEAPLEHEHLAHPAPGAAFPIFLIGALAALIAIAALWPPPAEADA